MRRLTVARSLLIGVALSLAVGCGGSDGGDGTPHFIDETATAGIDHQYTGEFAYFVGGGVAAFDCNGDTRDELFIAGGSSPAALYRNDSKVGGALQFTSLPSPVTDLTDVTGAYPLDIDADNETDLMVLRRGAGNVLLRGLGDCRFEDATASLGIYPGGAWTVAFSAMWEGDGSLPTLAFGNYLVPDGDTCGDSELVRPNGSTYDTPITLSPSYCTLSVLFSDWGRTGQRDLRMANDRHYYLDGSEQLWKIPAGKSPTLYTEADGWKPLQIWGMGIASHDLTGDGKPEVFITSQGDNKLQTLDTGATGPTYHDIAVDRGVTAAQPYAGGDVLPSTAWHPEFEDVNNDGFIDLFVTKGNVQAQVDNAKLDPSNLLMGQPDGTFVERAEQAGVMAYDKARGAALVDLNLDGLLDMVVVNREANITIRRNVGDGNAEHPASAGHWLQVKVHQPGPNANAIGGWLQVKVGDRIIERELTIGGGHAGGKLGWIHTGLGDAVSAKVRMQWPDGELGPWMPVTADTFITIDRASDQPTTFVPKD